ncbi:MAG: type II toxin-antitoxin system HicA family toxin [Selenomonadaceae bacterium]|nr:type II toxin-antitoxin system HicA family toxin [Selenomonadaceae bacterium]
MSNLEKAKQRLRQTPKDYTYSEAKTLLGHLGYEERSKGKTSGSRVGFFRPSDNDIILLHKPHPGNEMNVAAVKALAEHLTLKGDL